MHHLIKICIVLVLITANVNAEENISLSNEDHRLINMTTLNFNICVQQWAAEQLNNYTDVKEIAGLAVNHCDPELKQIRDELAPKMNQVAFSGLERHIKSRAIKKLLLQLMYHKSAQDSSNETTE